MKRIALIGNMNNNFFAITRYLRDAGYDAHLFYRLAMEHFQPKADSYYETYKDYCHKVDWLDDGFHNIDKQIINEQLDGFDFYIGQGEEAAAAKYCGYNMNVYYPYGSDIYKYAHLPQEYSVLSKIVSLLSKGKNRPTYKQMKNGTMAKYLKRVIVDADYIFADTTNNEYHRKLVALKYKGQYKEVPMPFIYAEEYYKLLEGYVPASEHVDNINNLRLHHDFILLYHGRQEWKSYHNEFTGKNTDQLIRGFATFINSNPMVAACLVMIEYGTDVDASKQLIRELGIQKNVAWFPKMYRKELMYLVKNANVCCGEYAHSFLTFGTIIEAMLMKKPVITYREDELYLGTYPKLYPCLNARESQKIADAISFAFKNPDKIIEMGDEAFEWVKEFFIQKPLAHLLKVIEQ